LEILDNCLKVTKSFKVVGGSVQKWGDIKVTVLEESKEFRKMLNNVQQALINNGALFNEPEYLGDGFKPHVTFQRNAKLEVGNNKQITSVSLVDMFPNGNFEQRRIIATLRLIK
jgi:hypothetical protein